MAAGDSLDLVFVPHLTPMIRGIHATLYATLTTPDADLQALFEQALWFRAVRGCSCRHIPIPRPAACAGESVSVGGASAGNGKTVVVLSVIDNLVKGLRDRRCRT